MAKKVMVVDDSPDFLKVIQTRLEANNYSVVVVSNAKEVIQTAEREIPDIILLDIVMPDMDGYEICESLKRAEKTKNIPIIILTGKGLVPKGISERCLNLGLECFFLKPVDTKDLLAKIEEILKDR